MCIEKIPKRQQRQLPLRKVEDGLRTDGCQSCFIVRACSFFLGGEVAQKFPTEVGTPFINLLIPVNAKKAEE